jgi:hypothetical protein
LDAHTGLWKISLVVVTRKERFAKSPESLF